LGVQRAQDESKGFRLPDEKGFLQKG